MNSEILLERAIEIAKKMHKNQTDKAGKPYIEHCLRVMKDLNTTEDKIVGVLHDSIEDTNLTIEDLKANGFREPILAGILAITKQENESYENYLERVRSNPIALKVKIADMKDNMNINRIKNPTEKDYRRLAKYRNIYPQLLNALATMKDNKEQ